MQLPDLNIEFTKASTEHKKILLEWHKKPHVIEFWDNSENYQQNMLHFLTGEKDVFDYWIGTLNKLPFSLLITSDLSLSTPEYILHHLSKTGETLSIDFMIGHDDYLGKGYGSLTLVQFMNFIHKLNPNVDTFLIDPAVHNLKAIRLYQKAGFKEVSSFIAAEGYFKGIKHLLMKKNI